MRYESESRTWGIAAGVISQRIRALPEFAEARALVLAKTLAECDGQDVAGMRALGGYSAVIERNRGALPDRFRAPLGSKLMPATVVSELGSETGSIRSEVQAMLQARARGEP